MPLLETIDADFLAAQRGQDAAVVNTLRLIRAELQKKTKEPAMAGQPMTDEIALAVLQSQVKQRREASSEYTRGQRPDLAAQEEAELAILNKYLPPPLDSDALEILVKEAITAAGPAPQFGAVMGRVVKAAAGRADGATISQAVKKLLG